MAGSHRFRSIAMAWLATSAAMVAGLSGTSVRADTVLLKNGTVYRGTVDQDNTLAYVSDNLKRVIFYNSKIAKIESDAGFSQNERFELIQPLDVHAGVMPSVALGIKSGPWDAKGRRSFQYLNARQRPVQMQQAINILTPYMVKYRGIDGFWVGQVATSQVPRPVILGLLDKVDRKNQNERLKIARWLIQADWYAEAREALDGLARDFPELKSNVEDTRRSVRELESREILDEVAIRRKGLQPRKALELLQAIQTDDLSKDLADQIRDQIRADRDRSALDRQQADALRELAEKLSEEDRKAWKVLLAEVLEVLAHAPDVARPRLEALAKAESSLTAEARFALAMSGWIVGADAAIDDLKRAGELVRARDLASNYLAAQDETARSVVLDDLRKIENLDVDTMARIVTKSAPPQADPDREREKPGQLKIHRVRNDDNPVPSEYGVVLPPEYHPRRSYPAILALHDGRGPRTAVDWISAEAARRGYIVIAPEYLVPGRGRSYHFSSAEHAAAILSLRDARKRYAIDSDRVYVAGQLAGAEMAWDFGLAHPDLVAGVVAISGFPGKYVYKYRPQVADVPLYIVLGDLAPAAKEVILDQFVRPMIEDVLDVTYVDYLRRGLEELPEEIPSFFDWMDRRTRDPAPKSFEAATAREGDDRFFGVIVRELAPDRSTSPEAADPMGKNLRPATIKMRSSVTGNLINLNTSGVNRLDLWVSPKLIDFKKQFTIRHNERTVYKSPSNASGVDYVDLLTDLQVRGDRQQLYYFKVPAEAPKGRSR
ncbi:alpha/beta hydrolase [Tundrisphaera lichenicola]|uniref:carboxylesterase family protein n=1 Tax=Tundrisphaera lichenicola TaxID=2029860 RepID=UPI003EBD525B